MYRVIRKFITYLNSFEETNFDNEMQIMWDKIEMQINANKRRRRRIKFCLSLAAASIVLPILFFTSFNHVQDTRNLNIRDLALEYNVDIDSIQKITILGYSDELLEIDKGAVVSYSKKGVLSVDLAEVTMVIAEKHAKNKFNQLIVPLGQRTKLVLSDGSLLEVNSGSRVIFPSIFDPETREIFVDGEVFLTVKNTDNIPFVVKAFDFDVMVLGTEFNVNTYSTNINKLSEVLLVKGRVRIVGANGDQLSLQPNHLASIGKDGIKECVKVDTTPYTVWREGVLDLNYLSLNDVLNKLALYYGIKIEFSHAVGKQIMYGKLDLDSSFDQVLEFLSHVSLFTYKKDDLTSTYTLKSIINH